MNFDGVVTINWEYAYDDLGRLIAVTKNGTVVEEYQYDANGNRTYERNDLRGIIGSTYYLIPDQVDSVRLVMDASGNIVKNIDYDSFGNILE